MDATGGRIQDKDKKELIKGAFFYLDGDGDPSDAGLHEDLLQNEDVIRRLLIEVGVIREVILINKKPNN